MIQVMDKADVTRKKTGPTRHASLKEFGLKKSDDVRLSRLSEKWKHELKKQLRHCCEYVSSSTSTFRVYLNCGTFNSI